MNSGRNIFSRFKPLISLANVLLTPIPNIILKKFWPFFDVLQGTVGTALRYMILKQLCADIGDNVYVAHHVTIKAPEKLKIGQNVSIHTYCYLDATGGITIGNDVSIAHNTSIISSEHTWNDADIPIKYNPLRFEEVSILSDVWIGCGCRILAGSRLENRSIVAAGAVVKGAVTAGCVFGGVPAKFMRKLP